MHKIEHTMKPFLLLSILCFSTLVYGQLSFEQVYQNNLNQYQITDAKDLNNDGNIDLVIGTIRYHVHGVFPDSTEYNIEVFFNNELGELTLHQKFKYDIDGVESNISNIEICDINNDKLKDIIITYGYYTRIYVQDVTNMFSLYYTHKKWGSWALKCADFNNDSLDDIFIGSGGDRTLRDILFQKESGGFDTASFISHSVPWGSKEFEVADMNNDNFIDIISLTHHLGVYPFLHVYLNDSFGNFDATPIPLLSELQSLWPNSFEVGYINNDSLIDIVLTTGGNSDAMMHIGYQTAKGTLDFNVVEYKTKDIPTSIKIIDLNNDKRNDIVINHDVWETISFYEQLPDNAFKDPVMYSTFHGNMKDDGWTFADFNNDRLIDIFKPAIGSFMFLWNTSTTSMKLMDTKDAQIRLSPNPTSDYLYLDTDISAVFNSKAIMCIYNTEGQVKRTINISDKSTKVDVCDLPTGIYFYNIMLEGKSIYSGKFIKI